MSGIEIAGLVLGAFPLLIFALEKYRESAEGLTDWWRIQRTYKKCHQDLSYHQILFEGNVERFLLPLVVDDDELRILMADPAGNGWEDSELEVRLKERLPKSYGLFLDIIGDINELMELLKKELGVSNLAFQARVAEDHSIPKPSPSRQQILSLSNVEFQAKRIKFSFRKSTRERLFSKLQEANERMRNLLESSDQIASARKSNNNVKFPAAVNRRLHEFWRHAKRLHEAVSTAWRCSCGSHVANLGLTHRTTEKVEFDVLFSMGGPSTSLSWQDTKIRMVENHGDTISVTVPQPSHAKTTTRVHWGNLGKSPADSLASQATLIHDLCKTLSTNCPDCFGFLETDEHRFMLYSGAHSSSGTIPVTTSLESVLRDANMLTRRKRYFLALTLASSYLQLGATPWLDAHLGKDSIVFLQDLKEPHFVALDRPYIRQEMTKVNCPHPVENIASLGIRLLELCFGTPLEATPFRKQLPVGDNNLGPIFDYTAAIQWSRLVSEEAGPEFAEAIDWCLHTKQSSDGKWRKDLWQHVVVPLDACHNQVSQKPITT